MRVLRVHPELFRVRIVNGHDSVIGIETVTSLCHRNHAIAGVNGGFFAGGVCIGCPKGVLKMNHQLQSLSYQDRAALGWDEQSKTMGINQLRVEALITYRNQSKKIDAYNIEMQSNKCILYTSDFNIKTLTPVGTKELIFDHRFRLIGVSTSGQSFIPKGGFVIAYGSQIQKAAPNLSKGEKVTIKTRYKELLPSQKRYVWSHFQHILSGGPMLVFEGKTLNHQKKEKIRSSLYYSKNARTAIGIDYKGQLVIVIAEKIRGKNPGMDLDELAKVMKQLKCRYAFNLDGGGSSTICIRGKTKTYFGRDNLFRKPNVYYHPSGGERPVGNAIIILPR